ncbi:thermonuclease family protein [Streptomyces sp. NBC_00536]|uniref:thermonuclease family protein n=1 Tax=Streptomyces sp. NBC_00536 TaxID=2975769 RepID=UPI002E807DBA|nr:thermonuclease family protein [Streptomyces sp. NBC_00536]WUC82324.1 thermonuclease family protein [Streptomyces sp. NBC_00536]
MPMLLIQGVYRIAGTRPDGDTVRFVPDDPADWDLVPGPHHVRRNATGGANLRLEAIDALETHYRPPTGGPVLHQPAPFADEASDELLNWLGFQDVQRKPDKTVKAPTTPPDAPGFILTRGADKYGRCVALAGRGAGPAASGTQVGVTTAMLKKTANHHMLATGLAFPTYYRSFFPELRTELTKAVTAARQAGKKIWSVDRTTSGAEVVAPPTISQDVVLPKLFRRLAEYLVLNDGDPALGGFRDFLAQKADRFTIISTTHFTTGLDLVVEVNTTKVKMTEPPENLLFDEG